MSQLCKDINWRRIAKDKLIRRELILLHGRQQILDQLIMTTIQTFVAQNRTRFDFSSCIDIYRNSVSHKILSRQSAIMSLYAQSVGNALYKWKGYRPSREIDSFRCYFQRCRSWFDNKKVTLMALHFWIPSMQLIQEVLNIQCNYVNASI
eukprot:504202_1